MNICHYFEIWSGTEQEALFVDGRSYTYSGLERVVNAIATCIPVDGEPFVGLLAHRSISAYAGVLGILKAGKGYVPLNPKFPVHRNLQILKNAGLKTLIVGREGLTMLWGLLDGLDESITLVVHDVEPGQISREIRETHHCLFVHSTDDSTFAAIERHRDDMAYMLFTSGSTGNPKGVPITHGNVKSYIDYQLKRYALSSNDRFSQTFDLTFDLSVHDMFLAWAAGAALYCIPESQVMMPAHFIRKHEISLWFSVPSLPQFMDRFKLLKPGTFPSLRYSLFCGEPLSLQIAGKWQEAAPNSELENIYGPTEATIGISHYRIPRSGDIKSLNGIISMGKLFAPQGHCLLDEAGNVVEGSGEGELCLSGSQLSPGYWKDEERTREQFIEIENCGGERFYRTGDVVRRDEEGDLFFLSRKDFQVKVRGYRVELEELSFTLGQFLGSDQVVTLPFKLQDGTAESLICFVLKEYEVRREEIIPYLSTILPEYMIPREIRFIDAFPLNSNGKIRIQDLRSEL